MPRPQKTWTNRDFEQFEALCKIQCSKADICAVMDVSEKTLDRLVKEKYRQTFEEMQTHFRAYGRASLLRSQFKLAERNPSMAIWLGKQVFGGIGCNPFNPALVARVGLLIALPAIMTTWQPARGMSADSEDAAAWFSPKTIQELKGGKPLVG